LWAVPQRTPRLQPRRRHSTLTRLSEPRGCQRSCGANAMSFGERFGLYLDVVAMHQEAGGNAGRFDLSVELRVMKQKVGTLYMLALDRANSAPARTSRTSRARVAPRTSIRARIAFTAMVSRGLYAALFGGRRSNRTFALSHTCSTVRAPSSPARTWAQ
jgi:hypothetical protein